MTISKLPVANRGEIAIGIMRTASELDIKTVAVFSGDDAASLHTQKSDKARVSDGFMFRVSGAGKLPVPMILEQGIRDAVLGTVSCLKPRQHGWLAPYRERVSEIPTALAPIFQKAKVLRYVLNARNHTCKKRLYT